MNWRNMLPQNGYNLGVYKCLEEHLGSTAYAPCDECLEKAAVEYNNGLQHEIREVLEEYGRLVEEAQEIKTALAARSREGEK